MIVKMRGVKPNFGWLRSKQSVPKDFVDLDLAMVTEGITDVFAKNAGARAYFRMILPPERPSWWRCLFNRITEKVEDMLMSRGGCCREDSSVQKMFSRNERTGE